MGWGKIDNRDNTGGGNGTYLKRWLPRLGAVYAPDNGTHLRLAAWRGMGCSAVGDATLAPATLAGFLLARPGDNAIGTLVHAVSLGADKQLSPAWLLEGQAQRRKTDGPADRLRHPGNILQQWQVDESRLALHWQPQGQPWAVSLAYDDERYAGTTGI